MLIHPSPFTEVSFERRGGSFGAVNLTVLCILYGTVYTILDSVDYTAKCIVNCVLNSTVYCSVLYTALNVCYNVHYTVHCIAIYN